jgi:hypothetical protein
MNNDNIYYFGVYKSWETIINPEDKIDNYEFLLKLKKMDNNIFEIIDILYTNNRFEDINSEMFLLSFKKYSFTKNMHLELDINNNIINISYLDKNAYNFKLYFSHINSKSIFLDSLNKIKENIIKNNKILSE